MGNVVVVQAGDPGRERLEREGWSVSARSFGAQLDAERTDVERLTALVPAIDPALVFRPLGAHDVDAVLVLDRLTADDYPGSVATRQRWGADAVRIDPGSWSQPDLDDWVAAVDRAARLLSPRVDGIALLGHSLGCWAVAEWLLRTPVRVPIAAFLVAPPDPTGDVFPSEDASTFVALQARRLPVPSMIVASTDDPYCELRVAEQLAAAWGSDLVRVDQAGHINSASKLGGWPAGQEALGRIENRALAA